MSRLNDALKRCPLIAILRGLTPDNAGSIGLALVKEGFSILEVPVNSPHPFDSISKMRASLPDDVVLGAGTLMKESELERLKEVGGELAIMPHTNTQMIEKALDLGLIPMPGVYTPTEAFAAVHAGAEHLKIFPANLVGHGMVKALRAVLPLKTKLYAVGGITPDSLDAWSLVEGFGIGGSLYKPHFSPEQIKHNAKIFYEAADAWSKLR